MPRHLVPIFAASSDLWNVLEQATSTGPLQFVQTGLFDTPALIRTTKLVDPDPQERYLVAPVSLPIAVRPVPQRRGGLKFAVDQLVNPKTIIVHPGGLIDSPQCLLSGDVGTISEDAISLELFQVFKRLIHKQFTKIQSFYVGPEAERLFDGGMRLTSDRRAPTFTDLQRD